MKIAIVSTPCYRKNGGVAQGTWQSALEFSQMGHEVHIITLLDYLDEYPLPPSPIKIHRIKINRLSIYEYKGIDVDVNVFRRILTIFKLIIYILKVVSVIHKIRPDIVQTKGIMDAIPAYITKIFYHIPYTLTLHGNPRDSSSNMIGVPALSNLTKSYWRHLPQFKAADEIISLSPDSYNFILESFKRESAVIPNGVNIVNFTSDFSKRSDLNNSFKIISVGMLNTMKGFEYAIKSMSIIIKMIPQAHLTIIGDGPLRDDHIKLIDENSLQNNITLVGKKPHHEIVDFLQKSHLFLLSSVSEGMPNALLEAMACGLPIVSTPVSISPEIINKWKNGYIVPYRDPDGIAEAVIRIYTNNEINILSERSLTASQSYTWKSVAEQYVSEFEKILAKYDL